MRLLPLAEVSYLASLPLEELPDQVLGRLIDETPWRQESVIVWGKRHMQPRLIAWYGDAGRRYSYSGIDLSPLPWTHLLLRVRQRVEDAVGERFNSVLLNYYRDQNDRMGFHSDDEPELGPRPVIASLSLGEQRTFTFKPKVDKTLRPVRIKLAGGSLLVMRGDTQKNWMHGIGKESQACGPRVNLTFRRIQG